MTLKERIKNDVKEAMRAKETQKRDTLRNLQAAIKQIEIDEQKELNDTDIEAVLMRYAKQREDAKTQFSNAGRNDLVIKEETELSIVKNYLPEPLSDEELSSILKEIIGEIDALGIKDMGKVMSIAKIKVGSRADGRRINQIAKSLLS
ncbi:MAG: GatB/YqeY domain-containing protein [Sulfurovum sp.]|nr:GatB/YqeY domain-containing protein [Sulfurovum sp.]MCB4744575.1 GatB/YqeY domain-containing protein [Sulfurovum sp.]MCB4746861.1 GatB/YqeY domain-containing protein [Sulfurovum sp.]MCB4747020.1 GatB/YqeY domain-containing protein [Sulfurovum sp.]MCB4748544.1 GatB/YqeY domain-containing protein [Sulfurovum sp.]